MDELYNKLLNTYNNKSFDEYKKETKIISKKINDLPQAERAFAPRGIESLNNSNEIDELYPDYDDKDFNKKIYNKKEFNIFKSSKNIENLDNVSFDDLSNKVCSPKSFNLTDSQKFLRNFMSKNTPYNSILLFHGVGQGKTCTAISIVENFDNYYNKPALIILSSTLIDNFKKQIFDISKYDVKSRKLNICTGTKYPNMIPDKENIKKELLEWRINRIINQKYEFMGYKELAFFMDKTRKKIENTIKDKDKVEEIFIDKISEIFSNRLIIIDEAHNLRNDAEIGSKQTSIAFKNMISNVVNVKLVLLTATPMFDNAKEIIWLLNLLLLNNKKSIIKTNDVFEKNGSLKENGKQLLIDKTKGIISYLNYRSPYAFPFRLFPSINNDSNLITIKPRQTISGTRIPRGERIKNLEIIGSKISDIQYDLYNKLLRNNYQEDESNDENETDDKADLQYITQLYNIVYPTSSNIYDQNCVGNKGFNNNFNTDQNGKFSYTNKKNQFLKYNEIEKYAPKIKKIIDYIINSKGIVFIYSRYYASGVIPLALALEHIGMNKFNGNNLGKDLSVDKKTNGNYIILSKNKSISPNNNKEIAEIRSKENKDGDIIKVIIGTKVASEGIDFKNIREIHLLDPWFNLNRVEQIIGRGIRYCSHIDLPKEKRNTTIMFHAITLNDEKVESHDLKIYRIAEKKQDNIDIIEKILIGNSIDCLLNKQDFEEKIENNLESIETSQGNIIQNYNPNTDKTINCYENIEINNTLDEKSFDKDFIINEIELYKNYIEDAYFNNKKLYFTYGQLYKLIKKEYEFINEEIFIYTLDYLIDNKILFYNLITNKKYYLIYKSNYYILQNQDIIDTRRTIPEIEEEKYTNKNILIKNIKKTSTVKKDSPKKNSRSPTNKIIEIFIEKYNNNYNIVLDYVYDYFINKNFNRAVLRTFKNNEKMKKFLMDKYKIECIETDRYEKERQEYIDSINNFMEELDQVIIDSIIDRLSEEEFISLLKFILQENNNSKKQKIIDSIINTNLIITDNQNKFVYFYNSYTQGFYKIEDNNTNILMRKTNILDVSNLENEYSVKYNEIKEHINNKLLSTTRTYVYEGNLKIRDSKGKTGFVCHKTSTMTLALLQEKINGIKTGFMSGNKKLNSKTNMCYIYELISRLYDSDHFQRPHFIIFKK